MTGGALLTMGNLDDDVDAAPGLQTAQELISIVRSGGRDPDAGRAELPADQLLP